MNNGVNSATSFQFVCLLVYGQVTIIFAVSVGLSVCLSVCLFVQSFSQPSLIRCPSNLDICYMSGSKLCPLEYRGCATPGGWVTLKTYFYEFWGSNKKPSYRWGTARRGRASWNL